MARDKTKPCLRAELAEQGHCWGAAPPLLLWLGWFRALQPVHSFTTCQ